MFTWRVGISLNNTTQFVDVMTDTAANAVAFGPMSMFMKREAEGLPEVPTQDMTVVHVARRDLFG
jgi:hypothetical protein